MLKDGKLEVQVVQEKSRSGLRMKWWLLAVLSAISITIAYTVAFTLALVFKYVHHSRSNVCIC